MHPGVASARRLAAVAFAALLLCSQPGATQQPCEVHRYTTAHYSVETDVSQEFAELVGKHMEGIYGEYARRFKEFGEPKGRFNVAVFSSAREYERRMPPEVRGSSGVFISHLQLLAAHTEGRTTEQVLRTLYHEGFHQFMFTVVSRECSIWLNEGLAEYFSHATWNGHNFTTGQVPTQRVVFLRPVVRRKTYIPFDELFSMSSAQWLAAMRADPGRTMLQYNQSWSIVHFLVHAEDGRYRPLLVKYLKRIDAGHDSKKAFEDIFGDDTGSFEKAWREYVENLEPSPEFKCRDNMKSLLLLARFLYKDPRRLTGLKSLHTDATVDARYNWKITQPSGVVISSQSKHEVESIFKCPFDTGRRASYLLIRDGDSGLPVLVCMHHKGVVLKAYYVPQPEGKYRIQVEEIVRGAVAEDLRRAIEAADRQ